MSVSIVTNLPTSVETAETKGLISGLKSESNVLPEDPRSMPGALKGTHGADASNAKKEKVSNDFLLPHQRDRFDPSGLAKLDDALKKGDVNLTLRALTALQHVAEQAMYGVGHQGAAGSAALQRHFQSMMMAVQSNNIPAAQQALARLQEALQASA